MKLKVNRNLIVAFVFIGFIFSILMGSTLKLYIKWYINLENNKITYSKYLDNDYSLGNKSKAAILTAEKIFNDGIVQRNELINIFGLVQKVTGNLKVYDGVSASHDVIRLNNGKITFVVSEKYDLSKQLESMITLKEQLEICDVDFLFVQLPYKINKYDKQLPLGIDDFSNENADVFISSLNKENISTFDLRDEIVEDKLDHYSLFFKTDHHWKPETGLWASAKICEELNRDYGFKIDLSLLDKDKFISNIYTDYFLGSEGKRVGKYYAGVDDFTVLLPKYDTDMSSEVLDRDASKVNISGTFEDVMIFDKHLGKVNYFGKNPYAAYMGGDFPLSVIRNNKLADKKILLLRDSHSCVFSPFFSLAACNELHIIDPRYYKGSISDYIDMIQPDMILMLYDPTSVANTAFFRF